MRKDHSRTKKGLLIIAVILILVLTNFVIINIFQKSTSKMNLIYMSKLPGVYMNKVNS